VPIRPELRKFYGREWRTITRPYILARAGDRCENCRKPNHAIIETCSGSAIAAGALARFMFWRLPLRILQPACPHGKGSAWHDHNGRELANVVSIADDPKSPIRGASRVVEVVLTVAHLNHVAGDDREENLAAWCQWCHLTYDLDQHRETRATRKDAARPLFAAAG
jgi:hypothetical protein